ncbi:ABC transporter ATP-binding protein [Pseudomonas fluorescens]|uniref:ABC transporter ATP-binding protein n=1 Tax=Pseudomonas fluorescens TaxID=294 RepID=UPI00177E1365|nr:ABC transporter ATP-binding protein [Pseudomonas fluorescens]MBD8150308.1 ABC transporter ATP-binding protein [Pseudomonas fluorescens]MBD8178478.1 ABC transporter ATP-binding protein [Pseudomonas fluorescens]MBD8747753.1 ABC transporter ATP-binding protein [Pseudomonas fluorescens]MBD8752336.1 ABC transporter ATP-binding protein [Pseudomonas fluorescens]MBD8761114.1 ABC transporter ATP-binding protein [Pseudomonas fluorescens]
MIEVSNLTKYLGKKSVISDVSFCAQRQECVGLFGEHGAGKTTLLNLISGMTRPTNGHISIQGLSTQTHSALARQTVGYQLQAGITHPTLSVKGLLNFVAAARGFSGAEKRRHVDRVATRLELLPVLDCPIDVLNLGLKRRVAIAQAILHSPSVLLLDEPTEGLSAEQQLKFRGLVQSLTEEMSVIIASRHYDALSDICTRALVIAGGRLLVDSSLAQLQRSSRHFQAVTLAADPPVDLLALAVLPGVAGIEEDRHNPGKVTVLAMPGHTIFPAINSLITHRRWNITSLHLEPGRLNDVVHHLSHEVSS